MEEAAYTNIIEMDRVSKRFGGIAALRNVSFAVKKGSVHALLGENGAGKSTLMKILSGVYQKDEGTIRLEGVELDIKSFSHSRSAGITLIPQELSLVQDFTIAENIYLSALPRRPGTATVAWGKLYRMAEELLHQLQIRLNPRTYVRDLSISQQQMVVIAKALSQHAKILIMDEPTARLGHQEVEHLLSYVQYLQSQGMTIIYISHHPDEIFRICDEITVLRDGATVCTTPTGSVTKDELIRLMVNRDLDRKPVLERRGVFDEEVLSVEGLSRKAVVRDIGFKLHKGEILGISGLVGAGRTEMVRALLGIDKADGGQIKLDGRRIAIRNVRQAVKNGLVLVPEERRKQGLVMDMSIRNNISLGTLEKMSFFSFLNQSKERHTARSMIETLRIAVADPERAVATLSGGNQQKVVIAKWMNSDMRVLFLDEPTRGIDVGAKDEIYKLIVGLAEKGIAIVIISSEIPELQAICDRVVVMKEGRITATLQREELLPETIMSHSL